MKKFELEDKLIEQQQSTNIIERLTLHIDKMWDEIGQKNTKMYELQDENYELKQHNKKMADALRKVIKQKKEDAVYEKEILDFCQINRTDN
jgi:ethanolamine utilization protein EutA (predicted chaperonin)|tara:strand:+ start:60 stop:332 length:273 start_codon:yes stop_codon:yes gene_type:complete